MNTEAPLTVVTVTYSPGTHLDRFLSSLTVATDRPCTVVLADNGSIDGSPEDQIVPRSRTVPHVHDPPE